MMNVFFIKEACMIKIKRSLENNLGINIGINYY